MFPLNVERPHRLENDLQNISLRKVVSQVLRLQRRIFRASSERQWGKVRSLQNLLIRSRSAKFLAISEVFPDFAVKLKKISAGIDGNKDDVNYYFNQLYQKMNYSTYHPKPNRRVYILKSNGRKRPLGIPAKEDKIMQKIIAMALKPELEAKFEHSSFGFRKNQSIKDVIVKVQENIKGIQELLRNERGSEEYCWVFKTDIKNFFENINHEALLVLTPAFRQIIDKWLRAGAIYRGNYIETKVGVPQGSVIGNILGNIILDGMDKLFGGEDDQGTYIPPLKRIGRNKGISLIRYVDDIIVIAPTQEILKEYALPKIKSFLKIRGLRLNTNKTEIIRTDNSFDFLGFRIQTVTKHNEITVICSPTETAIHRLIQRIDETLKLSKHGKTSKTLIQIDSIIRRWAKIYEFCQDKSIFIKIERQIRELILHWHLQNRFNQLTPPITFLPGKCGRSGQLIDLKKTHRGGLNMVRNQIVISRKFGLLPTDQQSTKELNAALVKLRDLKNIYTGEMVEYIKQHSYTTLNILR